MAGSDWSTELESTATALDAVEEEVRREAVQRCEARCLEEMEVAVDGPGWLVMSKMPTDLWVQLRAIVKQALKHGVATVESELKGYGCAP